MAEIIAAKKTKTFLEENAPTLLLGGGVVAALGVGAFLLFRALKKPIDVLTGIPQTIINLPGAVVGATGAAVAGVIGAIPKAADEVDKAIVESVKKTKTTIDDAIFTQEDNQGNVQSDPINALLYAVNPIAGAGWAAAKQRRQEIAQAQERERLRLETNRLAREEREQQIAALQARVPDLTFQQKEVFKQFLVTGRL